MEIENNSFDIILPASDHPTPLVIYIHGGGFAMGQKNEPYGWRNKDIAYFLDHKIAFATINYRFFKPDDSAGVNVCLQDIRKAIQYIKHNSKRYNIDKELVGCYGTSAGAGSSLYLAFHDDFARINDTSLYGESTRLRCAGAIATQATYDLFRWMDYIPGLRMVVNLKKKQFYPAIANFYGYQDYKGFEPVRKRVTHELDMLDMISPDDPPVYVMNLQKQRLPINYNYIQHHRRHALILAKIMEKQQLEFIVYTRNHQIKHEKDIPYPLRVFMAEHLK
ncbi:MAG: carboxylesterase family protein [Bacteroidetes bacterium]|nr:carboxylesterase family protein [Bacteroidota bacterium]